MPTENNAPIPDACIKLLEFLASRVGGSAQEHEFSDGMFGSDAMTVCEDRGLIEKPVRFRVARGASPEAAMRRMRAAQAQDPVTARLTKEGRAALAEHRLLVAERASAGSMQPQGAPRLATLDAQLAADAKLEPAHRHAYSLWKAAVSADSTLTTDAAAYAWLKGRPEYATQIAWRGRDWSFGTFRRYVSEARKMVDGSYKRPAAKSLRSAVSNDSVQRRRPRED